MLLTTRVPRINVYLGMSLAKAAPPPLVDAVREVMGGTHQSLTVREGRYVMLSGCRPHSCDEKGFVWVDTARNVVIGGLVHFYFGRESGRSLLLWSGQQQAQGLPEPFLRDFADWNGQWKNGAEEMEQAVAAALPTQANGYAKARLVLPEGHIIELTPDLQFHAD